MSYSALFSLIRRVSGAGFIATVAAASACGGSASSAGTGGSAGLGAGGGVSAGSANGGGSPSGGSPSSGGSQSSGGTSSTGGLNGGGSQNSGGSGALGGSGGATSGSSCSTVTTEAACKARTDCQAIYGVIPCPGSGAACPTEFTYCSNSGCGPACNRGSVCVKEQVSGGARIPEDDAGACPQGEHPNGSGTCERDATYMCQPIPAACNGTVSCACAQGLCFGSCQNASQTQIECLALVP